MMGKKMKTLQFHYPMIQFLIKLKIVSKRDFLLREALARGFDSANQAHQRP